jgi:hypothetical protein
MSKIGDNPTLQILPRITYDANLGSFPAWHAEFGQTYYYDSSHAPHLHLYTTFTILFPAFYYF